MTSTWGQQGDKAARKKFHCLLPPCTPSSKGTGSGAHHFSGVILAIGVSSPPNTFFQKAAEAF